MTQLIPTLMTVEDVAAATQMSVKTIRRATQRGHLDAVRIGRSIRVRPEDLNDFIGRHALGAVAGEDA